jgi:hypothetical protein
MSTLQIIDNGNGTFDLLNPHLNARITNEFYSSISEMNNHFITEKDGKYGAISKSGVIYLNCEYQSISICSNIDFIIYEKDNLFGIFNNGGKSLNPICTSVFEIEHLNEDGSTSFIIEIIYQFTIWDSMTGMHWDLFDSLRYIGHGLIKFRKSEPIDREDRKKLLFGLINSKGIVLLINNRSHIRSFPDINRLVLSANRNFQIFDYQLNLINEGFSEIFGFYEGASVAVKNDQCGLIDKEGDWIDGYDNLDYQQGESWWASYYSPYQNGFVPIKKNGLYGLVSYDKKIFLDPISVVPILFHNDGFTPITLINGLTGIMDKELNWVLEPSLLELNFCFESYNDVEDYMTSLGLPFIAKSSKTNKYGLISYDGNWICEPQYDKIIANDFYNLPHRHLFYLRFIKGDLKGIINIHGNEIFNENIEWRKSNVFDEFDFDTEDFHFELGCNYSNSDIPENHIYFLVKKDGIDAYYDAFGNFFLGDPVIAPI